jgi:RNA ligase
MTFPIIRHINDVLPSIEGRKEFLVVKKDGYTVIDYVYQVNDTFDDPIRRECRGLKFCHNTGNLIARPFHKFFNYGEKEYHNDIDWNKPYILMDKMDGSMIHPAIVNGRVRFMTRMGITEHAERCEKRHLTKYFEEDLLSFYDDNDDDAFSNYTPIFEWTSPENQIVLPYEKDELTLLAVRNNTTGSYLDKNYMAFVGRVIFNKNVVEFFNTYGLKDIHSLKAKTGIEGYVVRFLYDDHYLKIKTDEYVNMHRAVSFFERENMVLECVLNNQCDDLYSALSQDRADKLRQYENDVNKELSQLAAVISEIVSTAKNAGVDRKTFALEIASQADSRIRGVYFSALDGKNVLDALKAACHKDATVLKTRW